MNTFKKVGILFSALFILGACTNQTGTESSQTSSAVESQTSAITAEQVLKNTQEAMEKVKSYQTDMKLNTSLTIGDQPIVSDANSVSQVFVNPLLVKTTVTTSTGETVQEIVQYADNQFIYMPNMATGGWLKAPIDDILLTNSYDSFNGIAKKLNSLAPKMTFKEEGSVYTVSLHLEGADTEEFSAIIDGALGENAPKYSSIDLVFSVDKTTFLPTNTSTEMVMDLSSASSESGSVSDGTSSKVTVTQSYSKFDQIETFTLPEETKDAQPFGQQ